MSLPVCICLFLCLSVYLFVVCVCVSGRMARAVFERKDRRKSEVEKGKRGK
ncbi:hypothetical protein ACRRTK_015056 [Alexandromys fortis]